MESSSQRDVADRIGITIPSGDGFRPVATLVLGGIGTRLELPYERVDDLQLAVLSLLDAAAEAETSVEIEVDEGRVLVSVGPLVEGSGADPALARVLARLADEVVPASRDGVEWVTLRLERRRVAARFGARGGG
jgi:hypothetical protein